MAEIIVQWSITSKRIVIALLLVIVTVVFALVTETLPGGLLAMIFGLWSVAAGCGSTALFGMIVCDVTMEKTEEPKPAAKSKFR